MHSFFRTMLKIELKLYLSETRVLFFFFCLPVFALMFVGWLNGFDFPFYSVHFRAGSRRWEREGRGPDEAG